MFLYVTIVHDIAQCGRCGHKSPKGSGNYDARQVFDIPPITIQVTEHRRLHKTCSNCGTQNSGIFSKGSAQEAQYGNNLKSLCVYLQTRLRKGQDYQMLPFARCSEFIADLTGHLSLWAACPTCPPAVRQKVSGCFRSQTHAQYFATIRGYISTLKKNREKVLDDIQRAFIENLYLPPQSNG